MACPKWVPAFTLTEPQRASPVTTALEASITPYQAPLFTSSPNLRSYHGGQRFLDILPSNRSI